VEVPKGVTVAKAALFIPTIAALAAVSYAMHGTISAAVMVYSSLWRRHRGVMLRRELGPGVYFQN
jgi:hypothetical protein